jgi:hypothetical protein
MAAESEGWPSVRDELDDQCYQEHRQHQIEQRSIARANVTQSEKRSPEGE